MLKKQLVTNTNVDWREEYFFDIRSEICMLLERNSIRGLSLDKVVSNFLDPRLGSGFLTLILTGLEVEGYVFVEKVKDQLPRYYPTRKYYRDRAEFLY